MRSPDPSDARPRPPPELDGIGLSKELLRSVRRARSPPLRMALKAMAIEARATGWSRPEARLAEAKSVDGDLKPPIHRGGALEVAGACCD